jgi:membrane protease YdiL (CAAX protease family)
VTAYGDPLAGGLALAVTGLLWPLSPRGQRAAASAVVALLLLYLTVLAVSNALLAPALQPWSAAIAAAAVWLAIQPLLGLGRVTPAELGLAPPRAGSLRPAAVVTLLAVAAQAGVILLRGAPSIGVTSTLALAAMVAAVMEELVMRGVLLAFADRASAPHWTIAGASIGWGGLVLTTAFVLLHGLRPGLLLGVAPAALLYLWLRARTGSLAPPIAAHLLWNGTVLALYH